jgi:hypothetical protein
MTRSGAMTGRTDVVIPTVGRASLGALLRGLDASCATGPPVLGRVVVVDDRAAGAEPLALPPTSHDLVVERSDGAGPAAARNRGWRRTSSRWVAFLDDDVEVGPEWTAALAEDLAAVGPWTGAVQGRVRVPLPVDRPPTDRERDVARLEDAAWITADMAVRSDALNAVGGFDERFRRAYREDTDLAIRLLDAGFAIEVGRRGVVHPVRPSDWWTPVRAQQGNADDALMRRLHGPDWRDRGRAPRGRLRSHVVITLATLGAGVGTAVAAASGSRRATAVCVGPALVAAAGWIRLWRERRHAGAGPAEELRIAATSAVVPFAATYWSARGHVLARRHRPRPLPADRPAPDVCVAVEGVGVGGWRTDGPPVPSSTRSSS